MKSATLPRESRTDGAAAAQQSLLASPVIGFGIFVAVLYVARELLIPLAFALLFAFLLSPIVKRLQMWRIPRLAAAVTVFVIALGLVIGGGWAVADQLVQIVAGLPRYSDNIGKKIDGLKGDSGSLDKLIGSMEQIGREVNVRRKSETGPEEAPLPVEIVEPRNIFQSLRSVLAGLLGPLGTAGVTVVFTLFMLIDRENLRNRFLRLIGRGKMHTTTKAMDDAAQRVSRYVLLQFAVNVCFGVVTGGGLFLLGVPSAFLWGALAVPLRFLPYLGAVLAGSLPLILTIATMDGWRTPLFVFILFLITELITGNLIEPLLYGVNTGLSTVAVLVSAVFWTVLWGPTGLILSTPLTVCLSVLGRYIPQLEFLNILLGDEPVLSPDAILYQRLLAFDQREAFGVIENYLKEHPVVKVYDDVVIPALAMLEQDRHSGMLEAKREDFILQSMKELVTELGELEGSGVAQADPDKRRLFCVSSHDVADEIAAAMFAQVATQAGFPALSFPLTDEPGSLIEALGLGAGDVIVISSVPPLALSHAKQTALQIHGALPQATVMLGLWNYPMSSPKSMERIQKSVAGPVAISMVEALAYLESAGAESFGSPVATM